MQAPAISRGKQAFTQTKMEEQSPGKCSLLETPNSDDDLYDIDDQEGKDIILPSLLTCYTGDYREHLASDDDFWSTDSRKSLRLFHIHFFYSSQMMAQRTP